MVKTSPSIAACTASTSPAVDLLSETPELEKDYCPALLDEALKPGEGQGSAYRDGARWMLSSPTALEVCQEGASSGVTLRSFQGDPSPEQLCLSRSSVNPDQSCLTAAQPAVQTQGLWCASCLCHICKGLGANGALGVLSALSSHHRPLSTHFTAKGTSSKRDPALLGISAD